MAIHLSAFPWSYAYHSSKSNDCLNLSPDRHKCELHIPISSEDDNEMNNCLKQEEEGNGSVGHEQVGTAAWIWILNTILEHLVLDSFPMLVFTHLK